MKIWITTQELKQFELEIGDECLIEFNGPVIGRTKGPGDLVMPWGWVSQEYDQGGLMTAIKVVAGDPFGRNVFKILQVSPLVQDPYQGHATEQVPPEKIELKQDDIGELDPGQLFNENIDCKQKDQE